MKKHACAYKVTSACSVKYRHVICWGIFVNVIDVLYHVYNIILHFFLLSIRPVYASFACYTWFTIFHEIYWTRQTSEDVGKHLKIARKCKLPWKRSGPGASLSPPVTQLSHLTDVSPADMINPSRRRNQVFSLGPKNALKRLVWSIFLFHILFFTYRLLLLLKCLHLYLSQRHIISLSKKKH